MKLTYSDQLTALKSELYDIECIYLPALKQRNKLLLDIKELETKIQHENVTNTAILKQIGTEGFDILADRLKEILNNVTNTETNTLRVANIYLQTPALLNDTDTINKLTLLIGAEIINRTYLSKNTKSQKTIVARFYKQFSRKDILTLLKPYYILQ